MLSIQRSDAINAPEVREVGLSYHEVLASEGVYLMLNDIRPEDRFVVANGAWGTTSFWVTRDKIFASKLESWTTQKFRKTDERITIGFTRQ